MPTDRNEGKDGCKETLRNILGKMETFCILFVVMIHRVYTTVKTHQFISFELMQLIVHKLLLNLIKNNIKNIQF